MPSSEAGFTRLRLDLAYDGTDFHGWARQPGLRTVQGTLEDALARIVGRLGPPPRLTVAGRTDVGVHATGQVAHVDVTVEQWNALHRGRASGRGKSMERAGADASAAACGKIRGALGESSDIAMHAVTIAPAGFDARFSAFSRRYAYRVADPEAPLDPRTRRYTLARDRALDLESMNRAANELIGLRDFGAFCKPREGATTIRTLSEFRWERGGDGVVIAHVVADAFCHSMVRALVGACLAVGEGRLDLLRLADVRDRAARSNAFIVAPALGLTLEEVVYPPDAELAERAERTRARRDSLTDKGAGD